MECRGFAEKCCSEIDRGWCQQSSETEQALQHVVGTRKCVVDRQFTLTVLVPIPAFPPQSASHRFLVFPTPSTPNAMRHAPALRLAASMTLTCARGVCQLHPSAVSFRAQPSRRMSLTILCLLLWFCFFFLGPVCNETFTATPKNKECACTQYYSVQLNVIRPYLAAARHLLVFSHWARCEAFLLSFVLSLPNPARYWAGGTADGTIQPMKGTSRIAASLHPCVYRVYIVGPGK